MMRVAAAAIALAAMKQLLVASTRPSSSIVIRSICSSPVLSRRFGLPSPNRLLLFQAMGFRRGYASLPSDEVYELDEEVDDDDDDDDGDWSEFSENDAEFDDFSGSETKDEDDK